METKEKDKGKVVKKKLKLRYKILIVFVLLISSLLLWSRYVSTAGIEIKEYQVKTNNIAASFDGLKIVHLSDIHYGRTVDKNKLEQIVEDVNMIKPDIVVFTGDLIDKDVKLNNKIKNDVVDSLKKINALYGKYAISGNHDFYFSQYNEIIADSGFTNLNSNYDIITNKNYDSIFIGGLESEVKGHPKINKVVDYLKNDNAKSMYKILIMHTPDTFDKISAYNFNLVLAGHSHNGQIRLPFIGKIITPVGAKKYYDPYYKINNTDFFISGGLGTSTIDFRFFDKPSFNFYRIVRK